MPVTNVESNLDNLTLTITAEFAAPVERVWDVYADARKLERVWGPPSYPATFVDHDLTVGSRSTYYMTSPEGDKHCGWWEITSVDAPAGFGIRDGFADQDFNALPDMPESTTTFEFAAAGPGTQAVYTSTYASADALQQVLDMGVVEGASSAINQIDDLLAA